jgi:hypothetical protein
MVNRQFYQGILARLRNAVRSQRSELWENQTWMLHHDIVTEHASLPIHFYLAKHKTFVLPHPPISSDLATADFFLFSTLKTALKGRRFQTIVEIQENDIRELRAITGNAFQ